MCMCAGQLSERRTYRKRSASLFPFLRTTTAEGKREHNKLYRRMLRANEKELKTQRRKP